MKQGLLVKIFLATILSIWILCFYQINTLNYNKSKEIKQNIVRHPENLPTKEMAKNTAFWFANLRADFYWLQAIQYIWWNAIGSEYKKYLYSMLEIISELNPYFEHPYIIWTLLLPSYNERYESLTDEEQQKHSNEAVSIGLKWIKNFCDSEKLALIQWEYDLQKIWNDPKYQNPCKSYKIAFNLAFVYYFYLNDGINASYYYKVASAHTDSLEWAKMMTAIMQGKWWDREKAFFMFLNMASANAEENSQCSIFSNELSALASSWKLQVNTQVITWIQQARIDNFWDSMLDINEENQTWLESTQCKSYLDKAIRELNLIYIEKAHAQFIKEKKTTALDAYELHEKWYLEFLPTDPQQHVNQWIKYVYDEKFQKFDTQMQLHKK